MISWNVYRENFNKKEIEVYDIFNHYGFLSDCAKYADGKDKTQFLEEVRASLMYCFWSKCEWEIILKDKAPFLEEVRKSLADYFWSKYEWEIILSDWPPSDKFNDKKVSVYDQVMLNWDIFAEYVWEHKKEIIKRKRDYDKKIGKKI